MHREECDELARDLHRVGVVLHFHDHPALSNYVFLHPDTVVDALYAKYGLTSPKQSYVASLVRLNDFPPPCFPNLCRHGQLHCWDVLRDALDKFSFGLAVSRPCVCDLAACKIRWQHRRPNGFPGYFCSMLIISAGFLQQCYHWENSEFPLVAEVFHCVFSVFLLDFYACFVFAVLSDSGKAWPARRG